ncbi:hypothetical protein BS47DRAFT_1353701 [Hydnum rufescens UP504]|uniref:Xylanolytic transcriptional activator regulatory domain-containing protein n=1 Tax=Hydnum rufescens UP504 TaxID=1448309 RepID=A0A9P6DPJ9_9AGAM|nr:hypothetical protein BS47DRAFT_1353701 [Hydnum rufescens UP504]
MAGTLPASPSHYDSSTIRLAPQPTRDTASILSRLEHDLLLDKFFRFYSSWNCRVIPELFLRDFALATSPQSSYHRAGDNVHLRSREIRDRFAKHAKRFLEAECNAPTLSTVQALAILSSYHAGLSEQGMSVRMGQALGLNIWVRNGAMSQLDVVERNWVFWGIFCQDKCWSLYVGRDEGLRYRYLDIPEPEVDPVPEWDYTSTMSTSFLWQVKLMKIASSIMDVVYGMTGVARRGIDLAQVAQLQCGRLCVSWKGTDGVSSSPVPISVPGKGPFQESSALHLIPCLRAHLLRTSL